MTNALVISYAVVTLTNFTMQVTPQIDNPDYFTNYYGTNMTVSGEVSLNAIIGPVINLQWKQTTNTVVIEESLDLSEWKDIRIRHIGSTNYWINSLSQQRFYRLRTE